jgi:hypothetical protein
MTWEEMVRIEPRLKALYNEAKAVRDDKRKPSFCANAIWFETFKPRLVRLVGCHAEKEPFRGGKAFTLAYRKVYNALPDCRGCIEAVTSLSQLLSQ